MDFPDFTIYLNSTAIDRCASFNRPWKTKKLHYGCDLPPSIELHFMLVFWPIRRAWIPPRYPVVKKTPVMAKNGLKLGW